MGYQYEEELKNELAELGKLKNDVDEKKKQYESKRNQIQKWMEVNELTSHEIQDSNGDMWSIKFEIRRNKRIKDWKLIEQALGTDFNDFVNIYESSVFKAGRKPK